MEYEPGDHVGIFPANCQEIVDGILKRLTGVENHDEIVQLQILKENHSTNGKYLVCRLIGEILCKYKILNCIHSG